MKKTAGMLTCLVALMLVLSACGPFAPVVPEGYQLYDDGAITFAYPANWVKTDGSVVILTDESGMGNNITVAYENVSDLYANMTAESFNTTMKPVYEAMGLTVSEVTVEQLKNGSGTAITKISHKTEMNGGSMFQTMFINAVGDKNYIVTVTETTDAPELVQTVFDTLFASSAQ